MRLAIIVSMVLHRADRRLIVNLSDGTAEDLIFPSEGELLAKYDELVIIEMGPAFELIPPPSRKIAEPWRTVRDNFKKQTHEVFK